jgi:hypothetical protein
MRSSGIQKQVKLSSYLSEITKCKDRVYIRQFLKEYKEVNVYPTNNSG